MHVLFVHPNFPAQFGHIASALVRRHACRATFVNQAVGGKHAGIECIQYKTAGGATQANHFCTRTFENAVWHCDAVYQALKARPEIKPDLIVGHSGFGTTLFLRELYPNTPLINFGEYFYHTSGPETDLGFRHDLGWPVEDAHRHRARCRNAMILLDMQHCNAAYTPTRFQLSRFPPEFQPKMRVIFDGVDRSVYHGHNDTLRPPPDKRVRRKMGGVEVLSSTRVVTYVSRGFESMRGFDLFLRAAKLIAKDYPDVLFFVVGTDRICYGGDENNTGGKTFKDWALAREDVDLSKFVFTGRLQPSHLARLLAASDLHIYLTVPFVLSWSMMDALSCGAVVLASATPPVLEMIRDGKNGLLADFFDAEAISRKAIEVLRDPVAFRALGQNAEQGIARHYSLEAVMPKMIRLYEDALSGQAGATSVASPFAG